MLLIYNIHMVVNVMIPSYISFFLGGGGGYIAVICYDFHHISRISGNLGSNKIAKKFLQQTWDFCSWITYVDSHKKALFVSFLYFRYHQVKIPKT